MSESTWVDLIKTVVGGLVALNTWMVITIFNLKQGLALNQQSDIERAKGLDEVKALLSSIKDEIHSLREEFAEIKGSMK